MFSTAVLIVPQVKTTTARITLLLGCIAVLALQGPGFARGQDSDVRTELLIALELQWNAAMSLGRVDLAGTLDETIEQVALMSDAGLDPLLGAINELQAYSEAMRTLEAAIQEAEAIGVAQFTGRSSVITKASVVPAPGLTAPAYFDNPVLCKLPVNSGLGERNNTAAVLIAEGVVSTADIALSAAQVLLAAAKWPCEQTVAGVSVGLVCIPLEIAIAAAKVILSAAKEVVAVLQRCDATIGVAHLDAAFFRAEDNYKLGVVIHDDLASHDSDLKGLLAQHDTDLKGLLAQHDTDLKGLLALHDDDIKALLGIIVGNQLEMIRLLVTPHGRRSTEILACDGQPCAFPNK